MSNDTERLSRLLQAIGLDAQTARKRANQLRVLQERGDRLGLAAEELLQAMAGQMGEADTISLDGIVRDTDEVSPEDLLSRIEQALNVEEDRGGEPGAGAARQADTAPDGASGSVGGSADVASPDVASSPTIPQLWETEQSGGRSAPIQASGGRRPDALAGDAPRDPPGDGDGVQQPTLQPGERVDQYEVIRSLGHGGMGAVYLARDVLLGRKVALKLVHPHLVASAGAVDRFLFEARATARFSHPNIVTIFGIGQVHGCPYLALEYLPGASLRSRIREGQIPTGEALEIARRVASAMAEAHRQAILHCDLKPENIFLPRDGRLRVLDFGLARLVQRPQPSTLGDITGAHPGETGARVGGDVARQAKEMPHRTEGTEGLERKGSTLRGTAPYMAPEQWVHGELGPSTDIWAFGVTLFEILTGERPFRGSPVSIYEQVTDEARPSPTPLELAPNLPPPLAALCQRCLSRDPSARPSAEELERNLSDLLQERARGRREAAPTPFRGLLPFRKAHANLFFGRDSEIDAFLERLRETGLLAVVGPSGAGKSSFVQAGVLPRLESRGHWETMVLRPGATPLLALAGRLQRSSSSTQSQPGSGENGDIRRGAEDPGLPAKRQALAHRLRQEPALLGRLLRKRARRGQSTIALVVDQFEEVFTLVDDPDEREALCKALLYAGDDPQGPVRVLLTLREDFLGRLAAFPDFVNEVSRGIVVIRTPGPEALLETLTEPLRQMGYRFEDEQMAREMVAEVEREQSGLPLLQFAAQRLWEGRDRQEKVLRRTGFEEMGGVAGALADHADKVLDGLVGDAARAAREVLVSLVTPDATRASIKEEQLLEQVGSGAQEAIAQLVSSRLVVSRRALVGDTSASMLELVHESLISRWDRLRRWREESLDDLSLRADLQAAVEQWRRRGKRTEDLWRGLSLAEAIDWRERCHGRVGRDLDRFIDLSAREVQSQSSRLARLRLGLLAGLLLFGVAMGAFLWVRVQERRAHRAHAEAEAARREARERLSVALLEGAQAALLRHDFAEARAKVRASFEVSDSAGARALFASLLRHPLKFRASHPEALFSVATAPDGRLVATGSYDGTIRLWDWTTGDVRVLRGHRKEVFGLSFGPSGRLLASGAGDGDVRVWDLKTGRARVLSGHLDRVFSVAFSPSGDRVASASGDGTIKVWSLRRKQTLTLRGHMGRVNSVSFAPSGRRLYSGGEDHTVRVWSLASGTAKVLRDHTDSVLAVASGPTSDLLASGGEDGVLRIWNLRHGSVRKLGGHRGPIASVAFDPAGRLVATGSTDRTVRLWRLGSGDSRVLGKHRGRVSGLSFSSSGDLLASGGYDRILRLWDLRTSPAREPSGHSGWVSGVAFRPDGKELASASQDRTIRLWNPLTGHSRVLRGHSARVMDVAYSPDGLHLASASWDKTLRLWNLATGSSRALRGHTSRVYSVSYSSDGHLLASGSWDRTVRVWNLQNQTSRVLRGHSDRVFGVAFGPDSSRLASASWDKTVRIWSLTTGEAEVLRGHSHRVSAVAYAPSGTFVVSGSYDKTVRIWDVATKVARVLRGHKDYIWGVAISPDSRLVASASRDREIRVWEAQTGRLKMVLKGHTMDVNRVAFSPNNDLLVSGSDDTTVRLWDLSTGLGMWRASLLLRGASPRLLTARGAIALRAKGGSWRGQVASASPALTRLLALLGRTPHLAASSQDGQTVAAIPEPDRVLLWDTLLGRARWSRTCKGVQAVLPLGRGLVALANGRVTLLDGARTKPQVLVASGARLITLSEDRRANHPNPRGRLLVATSRKIHVFDSRATPLRQFPADPGVTAALLTPDHLALGYRDGTVDLIPRHGRARQLSHPFDSSPSKPVTRIIRGPLSTLALGFADGTVGLWNMENGNLLHRIRLHGPVAFLLLWAHHLFAATELADLARLDLSVYYQPDCALMRQIWSRFPATWDRGAAINRAPPRGHRCLHAGPR